MSKAGPDKGGVEYRVVALGSRRSYGPWRGKDCGEKALKSFGGLIAHQEQQLPTDLIDGRWALQMRTVPAWDTVCVGPDPATGDVSQPTGGSDASDTRPRRSRPQDRHDVGVGDQPRRRRRVGDGDDRVQRGSVPAGVRKAGASRQGAPARRRRGAGDGQAGASDQVRDTRGGRAGRVSGGGAGNRRRSTSKGRGTTRGQPGGGVPGRRVKQGTRKPGRK